MGPSVNMWVGRGREEEEEEQGVQEEESTTFWQEKARHLNHQLMQLTNQLEVERKEVEVREGVWEVQEEKVGRMKVEMEKLRLTSIKENSRREDVEAKVIVLEREAVMLEDKVTVLEKVVEVQDYEKKVLQRRVEMMGKMEQRKEQEEMDDMQQSGESYDFGDRENEEEKEEKVSTLTAEIVQLRFALSASLGAR